MKASTRSFWRIVIAVVGVTLSILVCRIAYRRFARSVDVVGLMQIGDEEVLDLAPGTALTPRLLTEVSCVEKQ